MGPTLPRKRESLVLLLAFPLYALTLPSLLRSILGKRIHCLRAILCQLHQRNGYHACERTESCCTSFSYSHTI